MFLRVGEITVCSLNKIHHPLFSRDVGLVADDKPVKVTSRHSKPDQVGKGTTIIIPPTEGSLSVFEYVGEYLADGIAGCMMCWISNSKEILLQCSESTRRPESGTFVSGRFALCHHCSWQVSCPKPG